jgi:hypothetical protein
MGKSSKKAERKTSKYVREGNENKEKVMGK